MEHSNRNKCNTNQKVCVYRFNSMRLQINIYFGPLRNSIQAKWNCLNNTWIGLFVDLVRKIISCIRFHVHTHTILQFYAYSSDNIETLKWPIFKVFNNKLTCNQICTICLNKSKHIEFVTQYNCNHLKWQIKHMYLKQTVQKESKRQPLSKYSWVDHTFFKFLIIMH